MPSRPKKKPSKKSKKLKQQQQLIIHHSLPTILIKLPKGFAEANSDVKKFCCQEEEQELACLQDHQYYQMADSSSNGKGTLEETERLEEGEAVKDVAIDDYSLEGTKEPAEESPEVVGSEEKEDEEGVAIAVVEKEASVVEEEEVKEEKEEEEQYVTYVDETEGASPVVEDDVLEKVEEIIKTELESNGVEESSALPDLSEEIIKMELVSNGIEESSAFPDLSEEIKDLASNGAEETEVPCVEENEKKEEVVAVVKDVASKEPEEVALPVVEEISICETSAADYKAETESANDEPVLVPVSVPVPPPVESADAAEGYGEREIPVTEPKPSIVSVTRSPLQPTSWRSCCGLFEALRRSDR